jgi:hypothetical protein
MITTLARPLEPTQETEPYEDQVVADLKHMIAAREYKVDSELVAEEILRKLRLLKWAKRELAGGGRIPGHPEPYR